MTNDLSQNANQPKNSKLTMQVTNDLTVQIFTNPNYEFLMSIKDVAIGYGVSAGNIRNQMLRNQDEFTEGKHFVKGVCFSNTLKNIQPHAVYWTKAGIIRLGFFIKSERAKIFRDWAEHVVLQAMAPKVNLPDPVKRKHNRLTDKRMIGILSDIAKIDDKGLRLSLIQKLGV